MNCKVVYAIVLVLSGLPAFAASLGTATRTVIPSEVQQIINVDYRRMKNSDTAMQMTSKLLPPNMKQFEDALKSIGVVPDRDLDQVTLAVFRAKDKSLQIIGIAQGQFPRKKLKLSFLRGNCPWAMPMICRLLSLARNTASVTWSRSRSGTTPMLLRASSNCFMLGGSSLLVICMAVSEFFIRR